MDIKELRELANKVNKDKEEKEEAEKAALRAALEKKEKEELQRRMEETPKYIEKQIKKAAENGEYSYIYEWGDKTPEVFKTYIKEYFKDFKQSNTSVRRYYIENYDMGTGHEEYHAAICFSW